MTPASRALQGELFDPAAAPSGCRETLQPGAFVLRAFAVEEAPALLAAIDGVVQIAPLRHMMTARGWRMSVSMTNCGRLGWISDRHGYRYDPIDPQSDRRWPDMPGIFASLAERAAGAAGFERFVPDACLVNRYEPGAKLSLHQDRNEQDFGAPIVSVSLGLPACFVWGGAARSDSLRRVRLQHGDIVVWGGPARLNFHGIDALHDGHHTLTGRTRLNLTFRRAVSRRVG